MFLSLQSKDISGFVDDRNETTGKKIRDAEVKKVPIMLIVGEKEKETNSVSVRLHGGENLGSMKLEDFETYFKEKVDKSVNNI